MFETETGFEAKWGEGSWREEEISPIPGHVGVYQLVDGLGRVLYVGFAKDVRSVLLKRLRKGDMTGVERSRWAEYRSVEEAQRQRTLTASRAVRFLAHVELCRAPRPRRA